MHIFFDLDGTLTDPGLGITNSVMYALEKFGIYQEREKLYKFIGPPLLHSFKEFCGFSEEQSIKAIEYYREYFGDRGLLENEVYDGIPQVLEQLKSAGHHLLVATSKPTFYAEKILGNFGLDRYFEYVSGCDMNEKNSTKADIIRKAMDVSKAACEDVLMIGDRKYDIIGAKANGVRSVGVLYGYGDRNELEGAGADYIAETVKDILKFR